MGRLHLPVTSPGQKLLATPVPGIELATWWWWNASGTPYEAAASDITIEGRVRQLPRPSSANSLIIQLLALDHSPYCTLCTEIDKNES